MVSTAPAPGHIVITSLLLSLIDHHGAASAELLDLWADQNADDFNLEASADLSGEELEPIIEMVTNDDNLDYRNDESGQCNDLCHASLLTVAGLASYAVVNGLATDNFITRRVDDITNIEDKIALASEAINEIKDRVDHAWKVSEKKSLHRRMERKQRELESDKLILQKRRDFLRLVEDGLARMRERLTPAEDRMDRRDDSNDNWGRELGLRVREALENIRKKEAMRLKMMNPDKSSDRNDVPEISLGTALGKRVRWALEYARKKDAMKQRVNRNRNDNGGNNLGEVLSLLNPLKSIEWWYTSLTKKSEDKRDKRRRKDDGRRFRRRHSNPSSSNKLSKRKSQIFYESHDWRPKYFAKHH